MINFDGSAKEGEEPAEGPESLVWGGSGGSVRSLGGRADVGGGEGHI